MHLILGEEEFLAERARQRIIKANPQAQVALVSAAEVANGELGLQLSPSLFAEERIVCVTKAHDAGKDAAELILSAAKDPGPGITLVVQHSGGGRQKQLATKLAKLAEKVHKADPVKPQDRPRWVTEEFQSHGVRVTPDVSLALLESVGSDLRELASAVSQLVADSGGNVTTSTVHTYYSGVAEVNGFDIADAAVAGKGGVAIASTRRALQLGISPVALAAALANKVDAIAKMYSTRGEPNASALGMHPFVAKKTHQIARRWSGDSVSKAVILVAELDAAVKGQGADAEYAIEHAVAEIAKLAP